MSDRKIAGYCPMGCGETLFIGVDGYVTCGYLPCPRPDAVSTILEVNQPEHLVTFTAGGFTIKHPLRERLDDALLTCELHARCAGMSSPPPQLGTYLATQLAGEPGAWRWVPVTVDA